MRSLVAARLHPDIHRSTVDGRGWLPAGSLGTAAYAALADECDDCAATVTALRAGAALAPVRIQLDVGGVRLVGDSAICGRTGACAGRPAASRPTSAWPRGIEQLVLAAAGHPVATTLVARDKVGTLAPVATADARALLEQLVATYLAGMRMPLPLFAGPSCAFVEPGNEIHSRPRAGSSPGASTASARPRTTRTCASRSATRISWRRTQRRRTRPRRGGGRSGPGGRGVGPARGPLETGEALMRPLDVLALPLAGTHLIEASAGTGKTWTIAMVALRLVVEQGMPVERILVVTYTRAATSELRMRIRNRLREARVAADAGTQDEALAAVLARVSPELARTRLEVALGDFNRAAVLTIHGFCQRVLHDNAFESGAAYDTELVADMGPLVRPTAQDFWARRLVGAPAAVAAHASSGCGSRGRAASRASSAPAPRATGGRRAADLRAVARGRGGRVGARARGGGGAVRPGDGGGGVPGQGQEREVRRVGGEGPRGAAVSNTLCCC